MMEINELRLKAQADQSETAAISLAKLLGKYMQTLLESGLTRPEAFEIVQEYHSLMMSAALMQRPMRVDE
jgi:hypothetical protein